MKKLILLAAVLALVLVLVFKFFFAGVRGESIVFDVIFKGESSGHAERGSYVIENKEEWDDVWLRFIANITPLPAPPEIDFDSYTVIAFFSGEKPTGGHEVEIGRVIEARNKIYVEIWESFPGDGCFVPQVITEPHHIIKIPKIEKEVEFLVEENVVDC